MLGTFRLGSDNDVNGLRVIFTNSDLVFYPLLLLSYYKISPGVKIARRRADTRPTHSSFSKLRVLFIGLVLLTQDRPGSC